MIMAPEHFSLIDWDGERAVYKKEEQLTMKLFVTPG
jgi:hypothetical protein